MHYIVVAVWMKYVFCMYMYIVSVSEWLSLAHFAQIATCFSAGQSRIAVRAARAEHVLPGSFGRSAPVTARSHELNFSNKDRSILNSYVVNS